MFRLVIRRLLLSVPLLIVVTLLTFFFQAIASGDTARTILGQNYTPEGYVALRHQLGLDQPLPEQYWNWLMGAVHGDLGVSPITGLSVAAEVESRIEVTLSLIVGTALMAAVVGLSLGVVSAMRGGWLGRAVDVLSLSGFSVPSFWLGLALVTLFAVEIQIFPATGYVQFATSPEKWLVSLVLPVITLAVHPVAVVAKQTRDSMLETLSKNFIFSLRANGCSELSVVIRHALRNASIPVTTVIGLVFVSLLNGTILVEAVFAMPGLGGLATQAATQHDVPMLQGVTLIFTLIVVVVNLAVDLTYGWLNPKVRVR